MAATAGLACAWVCSTVCMSGTEGAVLGADLHWRAGQRVWQVERLW